MKFTKDFIKDIMSVLLGTIQRILKIPVGMKSVLKYSLDMHEYNGLFKCVIKECNKK